MWQFFLEVIGKQISLRVGGWGGTLSVTLYVGTALPLSQGRIVALPPEFCLNSEPLRGWVVTDNVVMSGPQSKCRV